jgi:hypothetical protein
VTIYQSASSLYGSALQPSSNANAQDGTRLLYGQDVIRTRKLHYYNEWVYNRPWSFVIRLSRV